MFVVGVSGGKDSVCSCILFHEKYPDIRLTVLISEVYFDFARRIGAENPEHTKFIKNKMIPVFKSWGYDCHIVHEENRDYLTEFFHTINGATKDAEHNGRPYGFPISSGRCNIQRDLKIRPIEKYMRELKKEAAKNGDEVIEVLGIAADEPQRLDGMHKRGQYSILEEFGITEKQAWEICERYGLLSPVYRFSHRQGCWMCANASPLEDAYIKKYYPNVWARFLALEDCAGICFDKWSIHKGTLKERDSLVSEIIRNEGDRL